jgi:hypothetical protein
VGREDVQPEEEEPMENKAWLRLIALMLVLPLAVACSKEEETDADIEVETEPAAPAAPIVVTITPTGANTVAGELTATHEMDKTMVRLNLTALTEGKDYEARIRYGDCTVAATYLDDEPGANPEPATPPPAGATPAADDHETGEVIEAINLDRQGTTATGTAEVDNDELRPGETAYLVITEDSDEDVLVGCVDLPGHGGMGGTAPAPAPAPGTEPGAAAPAEPGRR